MRERLAFGERGQTLIMGVLMLLMLVGITSLVIDVGFAWNEKANLQKSADAAALAGIYYLPEEPDIARERAAHWAKRNGLNEADYEITITSRNGPDDAIEVSVKGSTKAFFARVFGFTAFEAKSRAVAQVGSPSGLRNFVPFAVLESELMNPGGQPLTTGDPITMKTGSSDSASGNRLLLRLPADPSCPWGSNDFRKTVYCGSVEAYCAFGQEYEGCKSSIPTEPGNPVGQIEQGLDERLQSTSTECDEFHEVFLPSPDGASDVVLSDRCNPFPPYNVPDSKRVVILPVIEDLPSGSGTAKILRFALFFITTIECPNGAQSCGQGAKEVKGIYVENVGNFHGYEAVGAYSASAPFIIRRLVE